MLEARMVGGGIDQRHQANLTDLRQTAKLWRVDQMPHALSKRHVELRRNPHQRSPRGEAGEFGDVAEIGHGSESASSGLGISRECSFAATFLLASHQREF